MAVGVARRRTVTRTATTVPMAETEALEVLLLLLLLQPPLLQLPRQRHLQWQRRAGMRWPQ